jgi:FMN-dependent NADH-azoreductase
MTRLLHVAVSARGEASLSRRVAGRLIDALRGADPGVRVVECDLAAAPPPHPGRAFVAASLVGEAERGAAERDALASSDALIDALERCDILVLSTPMHNFTTPSALKAWIDHVARPGRTFRVTPRGKVGMLADRPVLAVIACGGRFAGSQADGAQADFLTPYLRYVLSVMGLTDFEALRLDELGRGAQRVEQGLERARLWIATQSARLAEKRRD